MFGTTILAPTESRLKVVSTEPISPNTTPNHLQYYRLRSSLTLLGPLIIVGYYAFICLYFLRHPPSHGIILSMRVNADWVFYSWFIISVLIVDWARTGLANIEACAFLDPRYAPTTMATLMWHTDTKWSNPRWWMKALYISVAKITPHGSGPLESNRRSPGRLWSLLALATAAILIAIPLSGLSFQTTKVSVVSNNLALIYGPGQTSFGVHAASKRKSVSYAWRTGRQAKVGHGILFYAPQSSQSISQTYFDDMVKLRKPHIETFVGPAVRGDVSGRAWGLWSNLSCVPVAASGLQMIRTSGYNNVSINMCRNTTTEDCQHRWTEVTVPGLEPASVNTSLPVWLYKAGLQKNDLVTYSVVAAADGFHPVSKPEYSRASDISPYFTHGQHDNLTFAHFANATGRNITTGMIEVYLWETRAIQDPTIHKWTKKLPATVSIVRERNIYTNYSGESPQAVWAGFGLHCDVASAVGFAYLDPSRRQFSSFSPSAALIASNRSQWGSSAYRRVLPVQVQAIASMFEESGLPTDEASQSHYVEPDSFLWLAIQNSVGARPARMYHDSKVGKVVSHMLPMLQPEDLQRSIYKLLGQSMTALMGETGMKPWTGELYGLRRTSYIVAGPVRWQYVMTLLSLWALLTSGGALWMLLAGRPRWAPTLDGAELFKLGAQYGNGIDGSTRIDFTTARRKDQKDAAGLVFSSRIDGAG